MLSTGDSVDEVSEDLCELLADEPGNKECFAGESFVVVLLVTILCSINLFNCYLSASGQKMNL